MNDRFASITVSTVAALLLVEAVLLGQEQAITGIASQYDCGQILKSGFALVTQMVMFGRFSQDDALRMRGYICDWDAVRDLAVTGEDRLSPDTAAWAWSARLAHSSLDEFDETLPLLSCQEKTSSGICSSVVGTAYALAAFARVEMAVAGEGLGDFLFRYRLADKHSRQTGVAAA